MDITFPTSNKLKISISINTCLLLFSLTFSGVGCQTTDNYKPDERVMLNKHLDLIRNKIDNGDAKNAVGDLKTLLARFPNEYRVYDLYGLANLSLGNNAGALRFFKKSYEINNRIVTGLNLSSALIANNKFQESIALLKDLIKSEEFKEYRYKERFFHNLGFSNASLKNFPLAEMWYKRATEHNPIYSPSYLELGRIYLATGRSSDAFTAFKKSSDYCETCLEPLEEQARILTSKGKVSSAFKLINDYTRLENITEGDRRRASKLLTALSSKSQTAPAKHAKRYHIIK